MAASLAFKDFGVSLQSYVSSVSILSTLKPDRGGSSRRLLMAALPVFLANNTIVDECSEEASV